MSLSIRSYKPGDEEALVDVWNESLRYDPINLKVFERKVLLDPNFDPCGLKIAEINGEIVGFTIGIVRRYPLFYQGLEEDKGWITAIAIKSDYISRAGDLLLRKTLEFFKERRRKYVWYSPYTPNYFFPGVDPDRYEDVLGLLERHGFKRISEVLSMDVQLWPNYTIPDYIGELEEKLEREGIKICHLKTRYIYPFLKFLKENFSADWYRHALEMLQRGCDKDQILIAVKGNEVVGYCQYFHSDEYDWHRPGAHFGPFGVREDMRGKGIGSVLLAKCLYEMRTRGFHSAYLLWTEERAAKLYSRFGFKITRRFFIMRKTIE